MNIRELELWRKEKSKIKERAKIIVTFMDYPTYSFRGTLMVVFDYDNHRTIEDTHYHESWDWLIPVVEKVVVKLSELEKEESEQIYAAIHDSLWAFNLKEVYEETVEAIKYYLSE